MSSTRPLLGLAFFLVSAAPAAAAQSPWDEHFFRHVAGDVTSTQATPDGTRVVFIADRDHDEQFEIFSVPTDASSAPVQLNDALVAGGDVERFSISSDSATVAFLGDGEAYQVNELYCAPVDGSANAVRVSSWAAIEFVVSYQFTPDGTHLVLEGRTSTERDELWWVPVGGGSAVKVNGAMAEGGNPLDVYSITPDSTRVVYLADAVTDGVTELFSGLLDASAAVVQLNGALVTNGNVQTDAVAITPDGSRVIYLADQFVNERFELFSAPIDGSSAAVRISTAATSLVDVEKNFRFTAAGDVIYRADHDTDNSRELYLVPADGSGAALKLNPDLAATLSVEDFVVGSDAVVYRADQDENEVFELYAAPLDGSQTSVQLSGALATGGDVQTNYRLSADGTRVIYRADQDTDTVIELYGALVDGSAAAVKLNPALAASSSVNPGFLIAPDERVLFSAVASGGQFHLYSVPDDGSAAAVALEDQGIAVALTVDGSNSFAGDQVIYRGVLDPEDIDFVEELFAVSVDGSAAPTKLNGALAAGELDGDILSYRLTPDGEGVVYVAREKEGHGLYHSPLAGPATPVRIAGATVVQPGFSLGSDGERVVFMIPEPISASQELYSAPVDASAAMVKLSGTIPTASDVQSDFAITPDAATVVYRVDADVPGQYELWSVPTDGGAAATKLSATLVANGDVTSFLVAPDGSRVVYLADQATDSVNELYSVPVDGSAAPVKLNGTLPLSSMVRSDFRILPDSSRVLYRADEDLLAAAELHSVPLDGSAAAIELSGTLVSGGSVQDFKLDASGALVLYHANQDASSKVELYATASDGSGTPVKLNQALPNGGNVGNYAITPDGLTVVYDADVVTDARIEVWKVPSDGSAAPVRVHPPVTSTADFGLLGLSGDATHVLMLGNTVFPGPVDLYSVPLDLSASPVRLNEPFVQGQALLSWIVPQGGGQVLYRADQDRDNVFELYVAPQDGSAPSQKLSGFMIPEGTVLDPLAITADGTGVLFIADQVANEVYELFVSRFVEAFGGIGAPQRLHPALVDPRPVRKTNEQPRPASF